MTYLQACWSPCWCYNNVKHGTIAVAIYTIVMSIVGMLYAIWISWGGGDSNDLYTPFFETDVRNSAKVLSVVFIIICCLFLISGSLLWSGTVKNIRGFFLPWIVLVSILIVYTFVFGIFLVARYYIDPRAVLSAVFNWLYTVINAYCLLCVLSQYQILKMYQSPHTVLYP